MFKDLIREVCKGRGYAVTDLPFVNVAKNPALKIRNLTEYEAVVQKLIDSFSEEDWLDLFEHGIINKYGYAITYEFSHKLDKPANRYMILLKRPLQQGTKKPLVDDSPIGQMFLFGDELVKEVFGDDYELSKISILLSTPDAREQVRHIDYEAQLVCSDDKNTDYAIIVPFKHNGTVSVWAFSQHAVQASKEVKSLEKDKRKHVSLIREKLLNNGNFKIDFDGCHKRDVLVGPNEMLVLGGNTVHGGAKNNMHCSAYRVHYYVTHKSRKAPNNHTVILDEVVWDMTRDGARSVNVVYKECETVEDYEKYRADEESMGESSSTSKKSIGRPQKGNVEAKRSRGRPRKIDKLAELVHQAKRGRGRPKKVQKLAELVKLAKRGPGRPRKAP